jgi:hypothetical protein
LHELEEHQRQLKEAAQKKYLEDGELDIETMDLLELTPQQLKMKLKEMHMVTIL